MSFLEFFVAFIFIDIFALLIYGCFKLLRKIFRFFFPKKAIESYNRVSEEVKVDPIIPQNEVIRKKPSIFGEYSRNLYKKEYLMTKHEAYFFRVLSAYLKDKDYIICPKVRVEDIIGIRSTFGFRPWKVSGRLDRSHIDFLLIGKDDLKTKFAIEVDDYTHNTYYAQERDRVKNEACEIAGIPLIRLRSVESIKEVFMQYGV